MDVLRLMLVAWVLIFPIEVKGIAKFFKSYVENERKPTMVVFNGVCWKNSFKVRLMKDLFKAGIRSSTVMSKGPSYQDHTVLLLTDLDCPGTAEVFGNASNQDLHRLPFRWLALSKKPVDAAAPFWDPFLVDSDLVVATRDGEGYKMTELHKTARNRPTILEPRGVFHGSLTDVRPHREQFRRRCDVMGAPIVMVNAINDNNSSINHILNEDLLELDNDVISRNSWTYAKLGFLMLNATPIPKFAYSFGYLENGQWNGIVKDLKDYKGDIGTNIGMRKDRLSVVTYIDGMDNSRARFIFRQPALSLTANIFSLPFSAGVWLAIAIYCFVAGLAFCLSMKLTGGVMGDAFLLTMGSVSQQGTEVQPMNVSARIILWVSFTSLMALYAAYSAYIVVLLQAPSNSLTLAQLAKSKLTLAASNVDYNYFLFTGDQDPIRNEIAKRVTSDNFKSYYSFTEGVQRIRKGQFAFHSLVEPVYRRIERTFQEMEKCDLVEIDYAGYSEYTAPASKKSPYLELMRVVYKRLREVGIKAAVNNRFETRKPACKETVAMFNSVGLTEMRPVLLFMVYGVMLSVFVVGVELLVFHGKRFRLRRCRMSERSKNRRH